MEFRWSIGEQKIVKHRRDRLTGRQRRIHLSRSTDRLPIVYRIKSCSCVKRKAKPVICRSFDRIIPRLVVYVIPDVRPCVLAFVHLPLSSPPALPRSFLSIPRARVRSNACAFRTYIYALRARQIIDYDRFKTIVLLYSSLSSSRARFRSSSSLRLPPAFRALLRDPREIRLVPQLKIDRPR